MSIQLISLLCQPTKFFLYNYDKLDRAEFGTHSRPNKGTALHLLSGTVFFNDFSIKKFK